ncbi:ergothioneine biosynthesis protein EgtB [Agaribacterium haliotis]|uniref:ergothioneine biosynthesis protein EgtB n=1 Tax=Agaribacterium haliotis TaxID=2013869 RepID=UPI000BB56085|nr:ergothioneine biosynthesis protein EgtB [Agaribacterium haliotis]
MTAFSAAKQLGASDYQAIRKQSEALCVSLSAEDMQAQSMADASPVKWHLAHTSWFFETFILLKQCKNYRVFNAAFAHLFNSYYESAGTRHARPQRGLLTRPSLEQVYAYRRYVDEHMLQLLDRGQLESKRCQLVLETGLHHEMQHQELLLTDVLHLFSCNPLYEAVFEAHDNSSAAAPALTFIKRNAGMYKVGHEQGGFAYDNEGPAHDVYLPAHKLANRLVTNAEWQAFIDDKGYEQPLLWLSDAWARCQREKWQAPLYWHKQDDQWFQFGLDGLQVLDADAPVCHVSYYEAEAFARWAGKRLPKEHELESVSQEQPVSGNLAESRHWRPQPAKLEQPGIQQLWGDVWEWTQSSYMPYPGFRAEQGALGEYNGKFMINQLVLKGGSCVTPAAQLRPSYRNFFYPFHRWQFMGLRLAEDM